MTDSTCGEMTMSDVFKARFDGREWWATPYPEAVDTRVELRPGAADKATQHIMEPSLIVPERLVERVGDIPPEPPVGTVLWETEELRGELDEDVAWVHERQGIGGRGDWWSPCLETWSRWRELRHPLHPYPRAARDEIERLTAERDAAIETGRAVGMDEWRAHAATLKHERDLALSAHGQACAAADELQRRIDRARELLSQSPRRWLTSTLDRILRGEVEL
jgi:hypothetical protein